MPTKKPKITKEQMKKNIIEFCVANNYRIPPPKGFEGMDSLDDIAEALVNGSETVHEDEKRKRLYLHIKPHHRGRGLPQLDKCPFCIDEAKRQAEYWDNRRPMGRQRSGRF